VIALIVLLAWGYRLVTGGGARLSAMARARHPGLIEVISRASLGSRQTLHLVRVGPQLILIGATHDALRTLSVIDDPDLVARLAGKQAHQQSASRAPAFQTCLEKEARYYDLGTGEGEVGHSGRLPGIRQKLGEAVRRLQGAVPPA
jgi:flagellar biogenesis protein FliO